MRIFQFVLVILLVALQYQLWFGHNGVKDYTKLQLAVSALTSDNENLVLRNNRLKADIQDLKLGIEGVEERARNELGLIKPGETFFRVKLNKEKLNDDK